jgi:HD superfamily phosphohydrolase
MYRSVYNHRLNVVCNWLLERLVRLARQLGPDLVWADGVMQRWLWNSEELDLDSFLANDDVRTGYHLQRWQEEGPPALASLCRRFRERDLLKATAVTQLTREEQLQALAVAGRLAEQRGIDASLSCGLRHQELRGYHPYRGGLRLWDGQRMQALEEASPLVASLATPAATSWLIHPREIQKELKSAMDVEWGSTLTSAR